MDAKMEAPRVNAPRWFYAVLAACAIILSLTVSVALSRPPVGRWVLADGPGSPTGDFRLLLDTQEGRLCTVGLRTTNVVCAHP
jgi:hypothetical protein